MLYLSVGGEDIDYCERVAAHQLVPVPNASSEHPWWNNGKPHLSRFYGWSYGDGLLIDIYPEWTHRAPPNLFESLLLLSPFLLLKAGVQATSKFVPSQFASLMPT